MTRETFSKIVHSIPRQPGCYKYYDESGTLLYVGKAKDLRKRVSSYFSRQAENFKTRKLVSLIHSVEFTVTDTEHDAFLLENSLIKHYQPRYNIDLKDDKTYPYIVFKKEHFPRVFLTRKLIRDGSEYIGPLTGVGHVREMLDMIRQNIPLRNCSLNLSPANIARGKYRVCLEYHLGNCKGPCEGLQTETDYQASLQQVRHILKGNVGEVLKQLKSSMQELAAGMHFEQAAAVKQKIDALSRYQSKSAIVNPHLGNLDVITILNEDTDAYVNYMMISEGSIVYANTVRVEKKLEESDAEIMSFALHRFRERFSSNAPEIVTTEVLDLAGSELRITLPKSGDKKKLIEFSLKNARIFRDEVRKKATLHTGRQEEGDGLLVRLRDALRLPELPVHIECFDNSNFQGAYPVAAMVCFRNGKPSKKEYRHYHIKTVEGINDFASMSEIVYRRYKRLTEEGVSLPQLVIIDGGKGQLGAALESIGKLGLTGRMTVVGLAKREESVFFPGDQDPLQLPYDDPAHLLLRRIRDEVHRFGITFHRQQRSKGSLKNELESIPGIGPQTVTRLLQEFRSVRRIRELTERELTRVAGAAKARIIYNYFNP